MLVKRLRAVGLVIVILAFLVMAVGAAAAPTASTLAGPCAPGASYDPACDVDHDGDVDIFDIQLSAGHWNQAGTWMSDNDHDHLGQTWTGNNNPLVINGTFNSYPNASAPLVLANQDGDSLRVASTLAGVRVVDALFGLVIDSAGSSGVYVDSAGSSGVYVDSAGWNGVLVSSAGWNGVDATSTSATHYGGNFRNSAAGGAGVYARGGGNTAADLILGGTSNSDDDGRIYSEPSLIDSDIQLVSNDRVHVHLDEDNNSTSYFVIYNGANTSVWWVAETGMAVASGPSAVQVDAGQHGQRLAYAVTSPQNWIEDFGSGQLKDGEAVIGLESTYAEALSAEQPYRVFLTPLGDCALYVAEKGAASFTVRALSGEPCSIAFDYRIVGLRRGYETVRMERFVERSDE